MRMAAAMSALLILAACGGQEESARFEQVEDRADIENPNIESEDQDRTASDPGYRNEAPFHTDQSERAAPPAPKAD